MWDGVEDKQQDLQWFVLGITNDTVMCIMKGSYDQKIATDISGAGILLCCMKSQRMLCMNVYKQSKTDSSWRGELLGLVAIHTILLTLCRFYDITSTSPTTYCENIAALRQPGWHYHHVKTRASLANCLRVLWTIKINQLIKATYEHVSGHQDCHNLW
jgi:hypothetical protein